MFFFTGFYLVFPYLFRKKLCPLAIAALDLVLPSRSGLAITRGSSRVVTGFFYLVFADDAVWPRRGGEGGSVRGSDATSSGCFILASSAAAAAALGSERRQILRHRVFIDRVQGRIHTTATTTTTGRGVDHVTWRSTLPEWRSGPSRCADRLEFSAESTA